MPGDQGESEPGIHLSKPAFQTLLFCEHWPELQSLIFYHVPGPQALGRAGGILRPKPDHSLGTGGRVGHSNATGIAHNISLPRRPVPSPERFPTVSAERAEAVSSSYLSALGHPAQQAPALGCWTLCLGRLWAVGADVASPPLCPMSTLACLHPAPWFRFPPWRVLISRWLISPLTACDLALGL